MDWPHILVLEGANEYLFDKLYIPCPPGTVPPSLTKIAEADRELWRLVIDECRATLKVASDGSLPIDKAIERFMYSPSVAFHLFPTPNAKRTRDEGDLKGSNPRKRPNTSTANASRKGSGKGKSTPRMPPGLIGHRFQDLQGRPLCFSYNLSGCSVTGPSCDKGQHACAGCGVAGHSLRDCPRAKSHSSNKRSAAGPSQ